MSNKTPSFLGVIFATLVVINFPVDVATKLMHGDVLSTTNSGASLIHLHDHDNIDPNKLGPAF